MRTHTETYRTTISRDGVGYELSCRIDFTPGWCGSRIDPPEPPEVNIYDVKSPDGLPFEITDDECEAIGAAWLEQAMDRESCEQFDTREESEL